MDGSNLQRGRDLWLPGLVGLVGMLVSLAAWGLLVADRRAEILASAKEIARDIDTAVRVDFELHVNSLRGLHDLWRSVGTEHIAEWKEHIDRSVSRVPGLATVAWIDLEEPVNGFAFGAGRSAQQVRSDEHLARRHAMRPHIEGPERVAPGSVQYRVFLPVRTPEDRSGVLVGRFEVAPFLDTALRARARGYALSVFWGGEEIFSRGIPSADSWQQWWHVETTVDLPFDTRWRIVHRPTAQLAAARLTPTPHYLLAAGVVLSIVLAALAHQLRIIARQSRFLEASNHALEQRRAELESRVAERTEALEEAVTELEAFNYSVSHDLRSPLGAIMNFATILEEDYRGRPLDTEGLAILARIRRSAARATSLLEDLLQLSRAGRAAVSFEAVDMTALARESFAQVRVAEDEGDVEFFVDHLPDAVGDRTLLGDVFANLFSNALKYSRGCEKRRITVTGRLGEGEYVYEVADSGQGFDMRFADKLFRLFERLHAEDDIEGTGVGLAMVARIVQRHGGRVGAEGRPEQGARFWFAIPVREVP